MFCLVSYLERLCLGIGGDIDVAATWLHRCERAAPGVAVVDGKATILRDDLVARGRTERAAEDRRYRGGCVARVAEPVVAGWPKSF